MLVTVHAAVGTLIGEQINNPAIAFLIGFAGHFLLDLIPHGDQNHFDEYKSRTNFKKIMSLIIIDSVLAMVFVLLYREVREANGTFGHSLPLVTGIIGSILPDFLVAIHNINKRWFFRLNYIHMRIHQMIIFPMPLSLGLILQIALLILIWSLYHF